MMRMAGYRPMLAIDEFFKATSRGMEMEAIAFRNKRDTIQSIIEGYDANPKPLLTTIKMETQKHLQTEKRQ